MIFYGGHFSIVFDTKVALFKVTISKSCIFVVQRLSDYLRSRVIISVLAREVPMYAYLYTLISPIVQCTCVLLLFFFHSLQQS